MSTKKIISTIIGLVLVSSAMFALGKDKTDYGFKRGENQSVTRKAEFDKIHNAKSEEERKEIFNRNKIGEGSEYAEQRLSVDNLMKEKLIDQKTADAIKNFASKKHEELSKNIQKKDFDNMTRKQVRDFFISIHTEKTPENKIDDLLKEKIITPAQAKAIKDYLSK